MGDGIRMDLREIGWGSVDWIQCVLLYNKISTDLYLCPFYYTIKYLLIYIYARSTINKISTD
jgi:hypothetical protein